MASTSPLTPTEIVLEYVCPSLGLIMANIMFLAPLRDLQSAVTLGRGLGDLNPTPWAFMLGNCLGWVSYGVLTSDWFVFWANYPGFLIACWLNLGAVKLMYAAHHGNEARRSLVEYLSSMGDLNDSSLGGRDVFDKRQQESLLNNGNEIVHAESESNAPAGTERSCPPSSSTSDKEIPNDSTVEQQQQQPRDWAKIVWDVTSQATPAKTPHERLVMGIVLVWSVVLSAMGFQRYYSSLNSEFDGDDFARVFVGIAANLNLVFFYGAPLSTIGKILKSRRTDSLHLPTMITNTMNGAFWTAYALAPQINDPIIYVPNGLGVVLGMIEFFLWIVFPKTKTSDNIEDSPEGSKADGGVQKPPTGDLESATVPQIERASIR